MATQLSSLSARVAALAQGSEKRADDEAVHSGDGDADPQRAKFARSAAGKAAPTQRDARVRAKSSPSRPAPPPTTASRTPSPGSAAGLVL